MSTAAPPPSVGPDDFRALAFDALWKGRERTTSQELAILDDLLTGTSRRSFLEVGCGAGRLTPAFEHGAGRFTAIDLDPRFLTEARARVAGRPGVRFVAANLYHLPIADHVVDTATLVRVYNFLTRPDLALRELHRVLRPGGTLVLTCNPRPSPQTLLGDLRAGLHPGPFPPSPSMTFSRAPVVPVRPSPIPAYAPTRAAFESTLADAGFKVTKRFGSGLEDSRWTRPIPLAQFRDWGRQRPGSRLHSLFWVAARKDPRPALAGGTPDTVEGRYFACPRCRTELSGLPERGPGRFTCGECGWELELHAGWLDARFFPS